MNRNLIAVGVAVVIGLIAVYLANAYFTGVEQRSEKVAQEQNLSRIVVASQDMAFGTPLSQQNVRLANFPQNSVPQGAFTSIQEATRNRVALRPIVAGEPVLADKVSGTGGRATISANLPEGKLAYTVAVNGVSGVGGFARPGDMVDVLLTRQIPGDGAKAYDKMTDVVLQAVPVIGMDQTADSKDTKPSVAKTATLEVTVLDAQKLALASQLGTLSLALRNVADQATGIHPTVTRKDLGTNHFYLVQRDRSAPARPARAAAVSRYTGPAMPQRPAGPSMTVFRGVSPTEYEVRRGY